jgi:FtsP/CotA-like multicopper oxidase with cupredoxin domain
VGIVGVVVVAIVAIVIAVSSGGDDEDQDTGPTAPVATQTATEEATTTTEEQTTTEEVPPEPEVTEIEGEGGKPKGDEARIEVKKGDTIRFTVTSEDTSGEIHFHGYDISKELAPGKPARFNATATIEGIFEVEIEDTKTPIAEVRVEP